MFEGNHALNADLGVASIACKTRTLSVVSLLETLCMQQAHIYVNVCTYTHTCEYACYVCMYVMNVCMSGCMYVCMYLFMYLYVVMVLFFS